MYTNVEVNETHSADNIPWALDYYTSFNKYTKVIGDAGMLTRFKIQEKRVYSEENRMPLTEIDSN